MIWDDLRYLLALRRGGSLAAAARALAVDQTTVGRRLAALEQQLGTRLVERSARGHRLTDAGIRACDLGGAMESAALAIARELGGKDAGIDGSVRVTAPVGFVPTLAAALAELHAEHPQLHFELLADTTTLDLGKRDADIAVRMVKPSQPSLVATRVGTLPWALFASESYLRRRGEPHAALAGHDVIAYAAPLDRSPGASWLDAHAADAAIVARTNNVVAALDCAAAGLGLVAAPTLLAAREPRLVRLVRPRELGASPVFLVTHGDVRKIPRVRATLERLQRALRTALGRR